MNKPIRHGMTKEARNILRLLSRVGPDLAGATARDLKFLSRRGLKGFTPQQSKSLMAKGMLPDAATVLDGGARGTKNMLNWTPKTRITDEGYRYHRFNPTDPIKEIGVSKNPYGDFHSDLRYRKVLIPDTTRTGWLRNDMRNNIGARHEAREWVRGNAQLSKGTYMPAPSKDVFGLGLYGPEVGTTHNPGVIYDERVYASGLANRLGVSKPWEKMQVLPGVVRSPRDIHVGKQPMSYDFSIFKDWYRENKAEADWLNRLREEAVNSTAARAYVDKALADRAAAYARRNKYIPALLEKEKLLDDKFTELYRSMGTGAFDHPLYNRLRMVRRSLERAGYNMRIPSAEKLSRHLKNSELVFGGGWPFEGSMTSMARDYNGILNAAVAGKSGLSARAIEDITNGRAILKQPKNVQAIHDMDYDPRSVSGFKDSVAALGDMLMYRYGDKIRRFDPRTWFRRP